VSAARQIGIIVCWVVVLFTQAVGASERIRIPLETRTNELVASLTPGAVQQAVAVDMRIESCESYPYGVEHDAAESAARLRSDLAGGLATGLQCLAGNGPAGRLHPYHEYQAHRLLSLFEAGDTMTFRCVADDMFATAVATSPRPVATDDPMYAQLRAVEHPAVILDIFRLGGLLSQRFDDDTYRDFFHLADDQILEHRNGQPLRARNLHRYQNRAALLFHEVIHWLGHEHSAIYPDLTHLYETCCFGGSDYITDDARNRRHQQAACGILKDDALWSEGHNRYRQMRIWHYKAYDQLKADMRADYAR
jgi:hypothetical protein